MRADAFGEPASVDASGVAQTGHASGAGFPSAKIGSAAFHISRNAALAAFPRSLASLSFASLRVVAAASKTGIAPVMRSSPVSGPFPRPIAPSRRRGSGAVPPSDLGFLGLRARCQLEIARIVSREAGDLKGQIERSENLGVDVGEHGVVVPCCDRSRGLFGKLRVQPRECRPASQACFTCIRRARRFFWTSTKGPSCSQLATSS